MSEHEQNIEKLKAIFESNIKPLVERQGSSVEFVSFDGSTVFVRASGRVDASVIRRAALGIIRNHMPDVTAVEDAASASASAVTDTAAGGSSWSSEQLQRIQDLFDSTINPALAGHGGFAKPLDVRGDKLYIQVGGGCQGCGMASVTVKQGIESIIRQHWPEIHEVIDTTDHASGTNPYY
ncbi:NifU family protein, partial [bacterium]|nr:NifU family protein [bacterium]